MSHLVSHSNVRYCRGNMFSVVEQGDYASVEALESPPIMLQNKEKHILYWKPHFCALDGAESSLFSYIDCSGQCLQTEAIRHEKLVTVSCVLNTMVFCSI